MPQKVQRKWVYFAQQPESSKRMVLPSSEEPWLHHKTADRTVETVHKRDKQHVQKNSCSKKGSETPCKSLVLVPI